MGVIFRKKPLEMNLLFNLKNLIFINKCLSIFYEKQREKIFKFKTSINIPKEITITSRLVIDTTNVY